MLVYLTEGQRCTTRIKRRKKRSCLTSGDVQAADRTHVRTYSLFCSGTARPCQVYQTTVVYVAMRFYNSTSTCIRTQKDGMVSAKAILLRRLEGLFCRQPPSSTQLCSREPRQHQASLASEVDGTFMPAASCESHFICCACANEPCCTVTNLVVNV
jgi:hypothetical protein